MRTEQRRFALAVALAVSLAGLARAAKPTPDEMLQARRWVDEHFRQAQKLVESPPTAPAKPGLVVRENYGPVQQNARDGRLLKIADKEFNRGLYCHAVSEIVVRLPGPGESFTATVGIDTNGNYTGGSAEFMVHAGGKRVFCSPVMHRGEPGVPVAVDLGGAVEFTIAVGAAGDNINSDQASWAEAQVVLADGRVLWLGDMPLVQPAVRRRTAAAPPFSFIYGDKPSDELLGAWKFREDAQPLGPGKTKRTQTYTDPQTGLEVRCVIVQYDDYPMGEWTLYFKNTGPRDTPILENVQALDALLPQAAGAGLIVHHARGSDSAYSDFAPLADTLAPGAELKLYSHGRGGNRGGGPSIESLPFFNLQLGDRGAFVGLGWTGPWAAGFTRDTTGTLRVRAGLERTHLLLHPGEEIRSPRILMLFWQGDRLRAHNLWRRLLLKHYSPRPGGKPFAGLLADGNWGSWMNAERHIEEINFWGDHNLFMECYWVDAGWTDMSLGWEAHQSHQVPNPALFPQGMRPLADAAHRRGMKSLLWMVPESVHPAVGIGKEHPEWLGQPFGHPAYGKMVFHGLDHGNPQVNQFMIDHFSKVVSDFGVDVFRQDGGNLWPEDTDPNRAGMSQIRYIQGFYAFWDGLLEKHPDLLIDNCAEGGRKIDLETIRRSIVLWRSDSQASGEFDPVSNQGFTFGLLQWSPLCGAVVPTHKLTKYSFRSAYCPALLMGWPMAGVSDLKDRWSKVDVDLLRKLLNEYLAVRPYLFGDFYPLMPYSLEQDTWIAWQFDVPEQGEGMVQAFRRGQSLYEIARLKLRGVDAGAEYVLTNLDTGESQTLSGRELLDKGLAVRITEQPGSAVIVYKKAK